MKMRVAYSSSEAYANITYIAMLSLFENNQAAEEIIVYLVEENMTQTSKENFLALAKQYHRQVRLIPLDDVVNQHADILPTWGGSKNLCFKLFVSDCPAFADADTLLYLESDMIVCDDIREIFETDLSGIYVAGVGNPINCNKKEDTYSDTRPMYLNGGLNLFNLALMRQEDAQSKLTQFVEEHTNCKATVLCERIYNSLFAEKIKYLPERYNLAPYMIYFPAKKVAAYKNNPHSQTQQQIDEAIASPAIIHYAGGLQYIRPWYCNSNHPMADTFRKYNDMSVWKMDIHKPFKESKKQKIRNVKHWILKTLPIWTIKHIIRYL